jgi:hypothetical protein
MRFEVLVAVNMKITLFWGMYRLFRGISCLSHQDGCTLMMKAAGSFEILLHIQYTRSHDVISQTTVIFNQIFGFGSTFQTTCDNWIYYLVNT